MLFRVHACKVERFVGHEFRCRSNHGYIDLTSQRSTDRMLPLIRSQPDHDHVFLFHSIWYSGFLYLATQVPVIWFLELGFLQNRITYKNNHLLLYPNKSTNGLTQKSNYNPDKDIVSITESHSLPGGGGHSLSVVDGREIRHFLGLRNIVWYTFGYAIWSIIGVFLGLLMKKSDKTLVFSPEYTSTSTEAKSYETSSCYVP